MRNFYKFFVVLGFFLAVPSLYLFAQVGINDDNTLPDNSAMLDVKSTSRGFLPPRMTTIEMNSIIAPSQGLLVYNITVNSLFWFNGSTWKQFNEPYMETDPVFTAHPASGITVGNIGNWNAAYGWGNHAMAGYLTSYIETDPIFGAHPASGITGGNITNWNTAYTSRITVATGTAPLNLAISGNQLSGSINAATSSTNGYLTSTNWNTFNNKVSAISASSPLSSSGGLNPNISIPQANGTTNGFLSSGDWNTFNNKQSTLTFGNLTSSDITVSGGTGAVKGTGAGLTINKGNLTSSDIAVTGGSGSILGAGTALTINKGNLIESGSSVLTITGGGNSVLGTGASVQVKQANTSQSGYLSNTDWNSFNNKVSSQWTTNGTNIFYNSGKVGIGTSAPAPSAAFEVTSTNSGVLLPRITKDQRDAILSPAEGLMVFCTNCGYSNTSSLSIFTGGRWRLLSAYCLVPQGPAPTNHVPSLTQIIWNWNPTQYAAGYRWNTFNDYNSATDVGTNTSSTELGLTCNTNYQRYLWAYNECGDYGGVTLLNQSTLSLPIGEPTAGSHIPSLTQIVWNWNPVSGSIGYKWNNVNNYTTATDVGANTSTTETGLTCSSSYTRYVWAYSDCGVSTAATLTQTTTTCWSCGQPLVDNRNGKSYNTVLINSQCWMKENLNIGTRINASLNQTNNGVMEKFCYNDLESNCNIYGGSYQWGEAVQFYNGAGNSTTWYPYPTGNIQGICPVGWHLPMDGEWNNLEIYLGGSSVAGGKMKETGTTHWASPNTGATNTCGFTGLPGGFRNIYGTWEALSTGGYFWSATETSTSDAWSHFLQYNNANSGKGSWSKIYGWYVRCIKDI